MGSPTTPSFERGRGIPLIRAVMDMTTIEHDERRHERHAQPAARLNGVSPERVRERRRGLRSVRWQKDGGPE